MWVCDAAFLLFAFFGFCLGIFGGIIAVAVVRFFTVWFVQCLACGFLR